MQLTRKEFIGGSAALVGAAAVAGRPPYQAVKPFRAADYVALRRQLRAFHPD